MNKNKSTFIRNWLTSTNCTNHYIYIENNQHKKLANYYQQLFFKVMVKVFGSTFLVQCIINPSLDIGLIKCFIQVQHIFEYMYI